MLKFNIYTNGSRYLFINFFSWQVVNYSFK
ncbi:hypothetical protein RB2501_06490 [Robiginitalea biformata HTCC2501]|uniref:Uncharacterized protein n=1 Tax=Robiginitalea biformata (strain ATCC BAA-864 / DSM 15991 / KCTC 12146 / HTCC2501) TaxID=313596 RepID=A4CHW8_ROBBH|nr:hypothetical protein RB2501_06490 [Robiginitalea biformata HTCC2501]